LIVGSGLAVFQAVLIAGLATNLLKRKRLERSLRKAEKVAQGFSRQLIQAHEEERVYLAREIVLIVSGSGWLVH
jgi:hypothetical protein